MSAPEDRSRSPDAAFARRGADARALAALRVVVTHETSLADRQLAENEARIKQLEDHVWFLSCALARMARGGWVGPACGHELRAQAEAACNGAGMDSYTIDSLAGYCEDADKLYIGPVDVERDFRDEWQTELFGDWTEGGGFSAAQQQQQAAFEAAAELRTPPIARAVRGSS